MIKFIILVAILAPTIKKSMKYVLKKKKKKKTIKPMKLIIRISCEAQMKKVIIRMKIVQRTLKWMQGNMNHAMKDNNNNSSNDNRRGNL